MVELIKNYVNHVFFCILVILYFLKNICFFINKGEEDHI